MEEDFLAEGEESGEDDFDDSFGEDVESLSLDD